ncbi:indole-3-butyric acid response 5 [Actinidia rufa]|uniref:Indole-3-butyric acid response 5 n=1 Tax=Actinidia rufa TaxID=165716 RepID=A0A7J0EXG6_9ERIC|nr:indole-3-butyric acid response 5 [Actinidia rufa]
MGLASLVGGKILKRYKAYELRAPSAEKHGDKLSAKPFFNCLVEFLSIGLLQVRRLLLALIHQSLLVAKSVMILRVVSVDTSQDFKTLLTKKNARAILLPSSYHDRTLKPISKQERRTRLEDCPCINFREQVGLQGPQSEREREWYKDENGIKRSPAIVIAYLMKSKGWRLAQSYQWVKERRLSVELTQAVYQQLQEYEQNIFGSIENSSPGLPVFQSSGVPSFSFGFPKPNDPVPVPAFSNLGTSSIFAHPNLDSPRYFTFGAGQNNSSAAPFGENPPNPNSNDISMDGS